MMRAMKTFTTAISGLTASLLLNAGFENLARKFDPIFASAATVVGEAQGPALSYPCSFTPKPATVASAGVC